ncbi:MAG: bacterial transcriptional activator domain-containing protein [Chloroflexota bacterium]
MLHRRAPHTRERLAAVFWAEYPAQIARKYLRQNLWRLRQALESIGTPANDYLGCNDEEIAFTGAGSYWLDIEIFETTLTRYQNIAGEALTTEQAGQLEEAMALYTGDLLEGLYEDWCLLERERLRILYLNGLNKLMTFHAFHRNYERGLAYGERILTFDKVREKVHRQMMQLYWLLGDRAAALAQFRRCVQILQEELVVPPMPETECLYQQMVSNQYPASLSLVNLSHPAELSQLRPELVEQTLQRIRQLRATVEAVKTELDALESLLNPFSSGTG